MMILLYFVSKTDKDNRYPRFSIKWYKQYKNLRFACADKQDLILLQYAIFIGNAYVFKKSMIEHEFKLQTHILNTYSKTSAFKSNSNALSTSSQKQRFDLFFLVIQRVKDGDNLKIICPLNNLV